eukprot:PhM_4_TR13948/c0_g1_i1/m.88096
MVLQPIGHISKIADGCVYATKTWLVLTQHDVVGTTVTVEVYSLKRAHQSSRRSSQQDLMTQSSSSQQPTHQKYHVLASPDHKFMVTTSGPVVCGCVTNSYLVLGSNTIQFFSLTAGEEVETFTPPGGHPDTIVSLSLNAPSSLNVVAICGSGRAFLFQGHTLTCAVALGGFGEVSNVAACSTHVLPTITTLLDRTPDSGTTLLTVGAPFITCYREVRPAATEQRNSQLLTVTNVLATGAVSMVRKWWGSSGAEKPQGDATLSAQHPPRGSSAPLVLPEANPYSAISDVGRFGERIVLDPTHSYAAVSDRLGRVSLLDVRMFTVLDILKGYREVDLAWLVAPPARTFLSIYLPWRGVLEIHALHGMRLHRQYSEDVGNGCKLLANGVLIKADGTAYEIAFDSEFERVCDQTEAHRKACESVYDMSGRTVPLDEFTALCGSVGTADAAHRFDLAECIFSHGETCRCDTFASMVSHATLVWLFIEYLQARNSSWETHAAPHVMCFSGLCRHLSDDEVKRALSELSVTRGHYALISACFIEQVRAVATSSSEVSEDSPTPSVFDVPPALIRSALRTNTPKDIEEYRARGMDRLVDIDSVAAQLYALMGRCERKDHLSRITCANSFFRHVVLCMCWGRRHDASVMGLLRHLIAEYVPVDETEVQELFSDAKDQALVNDDAVVQAMVRHAVSFASSSATMLPRVRSYIRVLELSCSENDVLLKIDDCVEMQIVRAFDITIRATSEDTTAPLDELTKRRRNVVELAADVGVVRSVDDVLEMSGLLGLDNADCALEFLLCGMLRSKKVISSADLDEVCCKISNTSLLVDLLSEHVRTRTKSLLERQADAASNLTGRKAAVAIQKHMTLTSSMSVAFHDWVFSPDVTATTRSVTLDASIASEDSVEAILMFIPNVMRYVTLSSKVRPKMIELGEFLTKAAKL